MTNRKSTSSRPRVRGRGLSLGTSRFPLQAALSASLALLDKPNAPASAYRVAWGYLDGRTVIVKDTPRSLELQARYWLDLIKAVETLGDAAAAVAEWRAAKTVENGNVAAVLADHLASLTPAVHERVQTIVDLSPTLRAAMRQVETRQAPKKEAA